MELEFLAWNVSILFAYNLFTFKRGGEMYRIKNVVKI